MDEIYIKKGDVGVSIHDETWYGNQVNIHNDCENITVTLKEARTLIDLMLKALEKYNNALSK